MIDIHDFDAFCFDLDGTIYVGDELLPGAKEMIARLRKENKKILFITNSPTLTRIECQERLTGLGIAAGPEEVITATFVAAAYFMEHHPDAHVFIVGEPAIDEEFRHLGLNTTEDPLAATHVLVGMDRGFTYRKLHMAMNAVRNGAKLISTNPDSACPIPGGFMPDTMALASAIEVASGQSIDQIVGKPSAFYAEKMLEKLRLEADRCLIIGDRLDTDIRLGKVVNFRTCLVLTGSSRRDDIEKEQIFPDYVVDDLRVLL